MVLETFLRVPPLRSLGHLPQSRTLWLPHPACRSILPPVRFLPFRHRHSQPRRPTSMGGMTVGILLPHQLPSLDVLIPMHGRLPTPSPCQFPAVHPGRDEPGPPHLLLRLFTPALFLCGLVLIMTLTQNSPVTTFRWDYRSIQHTYGGLLLCNFRSCSFTSFAHHATRLTGV